MTVWVVGAEGMLGRAVVELLSAWGLPHAGTDRELDVRDAAAVLRQAEASGCSHVINCAAYTRVDDAEAEEAEALAINADGPAHLGAAAARVGAALTHISTDYVFDGGADRPYREDDPTGPRNAYGRTKLAGERAALESGARCQVIRTSWLFGEHGKSFVSTMLGLMRDREELRVVDDQRGRPTYCPDLAEAALRLAGLGPRGRAAAPAPPGIYHFANAGAVSWHGFAVAIRDEAARRGWPIAARRVIPITTAEFPRPAARPAWSVLDTARVEAALGYAPRPWQEALAAYLDRTPPRT